jgi:hypothetical protein
MQANPQPHTPRVCIDIDLGRPAAGTGRSDATVSEQLQFGDAVACTAARLREHRPLRGRLAGWRGLGRSGGRQGLGATKGPKSARQCSAAFACAGSGGRTALAGIWLTLQISVESWRMTLWDGPRLTIVAAATVPNPTGANRVSSADRAAWASEVSRMSEELSWVVENTSYIKNVVSRVLHPAATPCCLVAATRNAVMERHRRRVGNKASTAQHW